jgi:hypothetical protein
MTEKRLFILAHSEARRRAMAAVADAPEGYRITVAPPLRSLDQNAALHALLGEIAARCEWVGRKWDIDTWKRLLVGAWDRATGQEALLLPALDGKGIEVVFRRTSSLSRAECSELLEFVHAWAAENMPEEVTP